MRLIFYVLLFSQFLNIFSVFGENFKKGSTEIDSIRWEKVKEDKSNNLTLIPEINTSIKNYSDLNSTLALRYSFYMKSH